MIISVPLFVADGTGVAMLMRMFGPFSELIIYQEMEKTLISLRSNWMTFSCIFCLGRIFRFHEWTSAGWMEWVGCSEWAEAVWCFTLQSSMSSPTSAVREGARGGAGRCRPTQPPIRNVSLNFSKIVSHHHQEEYSLLNHFLHSSLWILFLELSLILEFWRFPWIFLHLLLRFASLASEFEDIFSFAIQLRRGIPQLNGTLERRLKCCLPVQRIPFHFFQCLRLLKGLIFALFKIN